MFSDALNCCITAKNYEAIFPDQVCPNTQSYHDIPILQDDK